MTLQLIKPEDPPTAATYTQVIVGVETLSRPEYLIEVDAIAVTDG